jgi:hypothetical protein
MPTIVVPPLNAWAFNTTISATPTSPLNTAKAQNFRGLRGVFKITVTNHSGSLPPYYFSFVMKGGTGMYTGDPGRPFYYILGTAVDNLSNPLNVETMSYPMYTAVQIKTKRPIANPILYKFTFPIGITQFTFPKIKRLSGAQITGDVTIKVESYTPAIV